MTRRSRRLLVRALPSCRGAAAADGVCRNSSARALYPGDPPRMRRGAARILIFGLAAGFGAWR